MLNSDESVTMCPICGPTFEARYDAAYSEYENKYQSIRPNIDLAEGQELSAQIRAAWDKVSECYKETGLTFDETWSIGIEDGSFQVQYHGKCNRPGCGYEFKHGHGPNGPNKTLLPLVRNTQK